MRGRILLQDLNSHDYLAADGGWAASCRQARVFDHTYLALMEGLDHAEKHTQVVWCFENPSENMYMLVRPYDNGTVHPCVTCPLFAARRATAVREALLESERSAAA